ncbi:fibroblast growth factor 1-like [Paramuricea clavata]|uniref:Fibroblast growth factor 1-like n=1 Tax=Paramuricea clavata TaxID=317549 RepID=A0A6S7IB29_PARCT|nr:fibroblast growth factor 1-like [Paramuricea clavata]
MVSQFTRKIIISMVLFFITYPLSACKSLSSDNTTTTVSTNAVKKLKEIINLKERANLLKDCNTTKGKVLDEIIKRYKNILKNMSNNGVKKPTRLRIKDLVRGRNIVDSFTKPFTNQRKQKLSFKNGQFLSLDSSGRVNGTFVTDGNQNTIFYMKTKAPQVIMIQSLQTQKFVAMDKHGHILAKVSGRL